MCKMGLAFLHTKKVFLCVKMDFKRTWRFFMCFNHSCVFKTDHFWQLFLICKSIFLVCKRLLLFERVLIHRVHIVRIKLAKTLFGPIATFFGWIFLCNNSFYIPLQLITPIITRIFFYKNTLVIIGSNYFRHDWAYCVYTLTL